MYIYIYIIHDTCMLMIFLITIHDIMHSALPNNKMYFKLYTNSSDDSKMIKF